MRIVAVILVSFLTGCTGAQVLNSLTPLEGIDVAVNVVYDAESGGRLDVYSPRNMTRAPVVVFFLGSRWQQGNKGDFQFVGQALASQGFVAVVPDVRLHPPARFPLFVEDGAQAVVWTRENIGRYGGNPDKLFLMGHSSGAHIAALLALDEAYLKNAGGNPYWIQGFIGLAGPYDFLPIRAPDLVEIFAPAADPGQTQPVNFMDREAPPLLLMHAEDDERVAVRNTRSLAEAARRAGVAVETVFYPTISCILGVDSHGCMIAVLSSPLRTRSDVLSHISDFVRRRSEAPPREAPGPRVAPARDR